MAKVFTQEEREKIKGQIVELVQQRGRMTLRELAEIVGASRETISGYITEMDARLYPTARHGVFPSEEAWLAWRSEHPGRPTKITKVAAVDPGLIRALSDGKIRRYDRRHNIICEECRNSESMQRVLAFYRGNFQE
ncbi:DUF977 family protein [Escherichia coli]|uniref:DUF977 family protein n=1 Tax=Escherichia coli TaxID=562 RepID=UPI00025CAA9E|nr:DUF977 family protein [Escherichia coli]EHT2177798.1 DUF977 family protein [Escherichia coli O116]EKF4570505.1 DUF977 family protein [Escherichia coli O104]EKF4585453.1 DUF977 family protein [Escherichia coli O26]EKH6183916.1 DUF977 family protein [Escherichia coli O111]EKH6195683.1 DUF977 family protein [Escherichia coli O103]EKK2305976.1 DUF977 family protein [Escherichia coli OX25]EKK2900306.1 DUF977 family protein [Escherichia coli O96]EKK3636313.1 DUF977 family protein [Escherichia 